MNNTWFLAVSATLSLMLPAQRVAFSDDAVEPIVVAAAAPWSEYANTVVPAIDRGLSRDGNGFSAKAHLSDGSMENMELLKAGEVGAALAQMDVIAQTGFSKDRGRYLVFGRIAPEALLCATHKESGITRFDDVLQELDKPAIISAGKPMSGTAATIRYLRQKVDAFAAANVEIVNKDTAIELTRLANGERDLVCFVIMPNPDNALIRKVSQTKNLRFLDIEIPSLNELAVNGQEVYSAMEVPVTPGYWGLGADKVTTLVTWLGLVVDQRAMSEPAAEALARVMIDVNLLPSDSVAARANRLYDHYAAQSKGYLERASEWTREAFDETKAWTSEQAEQAGEWSKEAWDTTKGWTKEKTEQAGEWSKEAWDKTRDWTEDKAEQAGEWSKEAWDKATGRTPMEDVPEKHADAPKPAATGLASEAADNPPGPDEIGTDVAPGTNENPPEAETSETGATESPSAP